MPKVGALWTKTKNFDGQEKLYYNGTVEIEGQRYFLDLYHTSSSNPNAPAFEVYLKPATKQPEPSY